MPPVPLIRWGLIFLAAPIRLTDEQKLDLVRVAARAWFEDESPIDFDWPGLHGRLVASGEVLQVGSLVGQAFEAEVHTPEGSGTVRFLVTEAQLRLAAPQPAAEA